MNYQEVFRHRGKSYDFAMQNYPNARNLEFEQLFYRIPLKENEIILDVASLGGYLKKYCLDSNQIISLDFSDSINNIDMVSPYEKWNIPPVDRIVCLAAIHHIENFDLFLNNLKNHVSKNGIIHLADVSINNTISKFLDDFVGKYTSTGSHKGIYYDWKQLSFPNDLNIVSIENRKCPWVFQTENQMAEFCKLLFDLQNVSNDNILDALNRFVGYINIDNIIYLNWELTYTDFIYKND